MRTLFDKDAKKELLQRYQKLNAQARPQWGKMNAAQMLAHCTAAMQVPVGDLKLKRGFLSLIGWMFKGSMLADRPFSKNSPTAAEFKVADERTFDVENKRFLEVFHKLSQGPAAITCHEHAFFGKMSDEDWGRLMYKHVDHHFQQFGI